MSTMDQRRDRQRLPLAVTIGEMYSRGGIIYGMFAARVSSCAGALTVITVGDIRKLAMVNPSRSTRTAASIVAVLVVLALMQQGGPVESAEIRVFSSAAPRGVFRDLVPEFERTTGHRLLINYEFASDLKRRIEAGDPFDVAILPPDLADDLVQRGKLGPASRVDLGRTGIGVAVRKGAPKPDISTVDAFRRVHLKAPAVAYANGRTTGENIADILARLGIAQAMK